jgi:hypothetical protein
MISMRHMDVWPSALTTAPNNAGVDEYAFARTKSPGVSRCPRQRIQHSMMIDMSLTRAFSFSCELLDHTLVLVHAHTHALVTVRFLIWDVNVFMSMAQILVFILRTIIKSFFCEFCCFSKQISQIYIKGKYELV